MANRANNGGVTPAMLTATGRDSGPDIVLKVIKTGLALPALPANAPVAGIINDNSSITEVLNIVAYLTIPDQPRTVGPAANVFPPWFDATHSVIDAANGNVPGPTDPNGFYAAAALAALDNTLFIRAAAVSSMLYDLDLMAPVNIANPDIIPVCIRRRDPPNAGIIGQVADVAAGPSGGNIPVGAPGATMVSALMSDCVKQMINILENTRSIFGPKGWTSLFNKVKGGGAKNHAKRTHRQHRRRYSSKQY